MNLRYFKNLIPVAAVAFAVAGLSSCTKDLDVTPIDPSSTMTPSEPELFTKCYATMALSGNYGGDSNDCDIDRLDGGTTGFVRQMWNANELTTDEAICAWGDPGIPEFNYNSWGSSHPMLEGFYNRLYTSIAFCNHYLDVCNGIDATRTAEVRFLRAMYYYFLMDCFGNVPFATELMSTSPQQIQRADLFNWIESELLEVKDQMQTPVARTSKSEGYGRADQDAANLLLARLYLNAAVYTGSTRWAEAKEYAEKVINGPHKLWTNGTNGWSAYQMLFMGDNGSNGASVEAILPILQDGVKTTAWCTSLFLMASTWKADMDTEQDYGSSEFWAGNRARSQLIAKFFPNGNAPQSSIQEMATAAGDDRALFFGIDRELVVSTPTEFTSGYSVGKYRNTYAGSGSPHNSQFPDTDFFLMRAAEAYLIAAEADARINGGTTTSAGANYINALRQRAHATTKDSYSVDQILDERSRELYYEGFRRTDLIRYGYFGGDKSGQFLWDWKAHSPNGAGFAEYLNIFALPAEDVNANPKLKQNPGY
jgi:hypothetical protein